MSVCKLGFFSKEKTVKCQNMETHLNLLAANLKNNTLRRMLCAYIQQELYSLTTRNLSNKAKTSQKRLLTRLKLKIRKRRAKKHLIVKNTAKPAPFPGRKLSAYQDKNSRDQRYNAYQDIGNRNSRD